MSALNQQLASYGGAAVTGQVVLTGAGNWTVPAGVTSISLAGVAPGGGNFLIPKVGTNPGGGGELRYKNNYAVTPGQIIPYVVGTPGNTTSDGPATTFNSTVLVANGGKRGSSGGPGLGGTGGTGDGGGDGGDAVTAFGGGGGAGGYNGKGGNGNNSAGVAAGAGTGAAGGGGNSENGGGVGLLGKSNDGTTHGGGGSGGSNGNAGNVGLYGGGVCNSGSSTNPIGGLRIIWPGTTRSFPSTNTADM